MYKNYVRSTDIVRVISGCFCSYSSMKLLYSVVCISILNVQFSYHYPYDPNLAHASKCIKNTINVYTMKSSYM